MSEKKTVQYLTARDTASIKDAMGVVDRGLLGVVFVVDSENRLAGVATDGDIRRAILQGSSLGSSIAKIMNTNPIVKKGSGEFLLTDGIRSKIPVEGSLKIPVLDDDGKLVDLLFVYQDRMHSLLSKPDKRAVVNRGGVKSVLIIGGAGYLGSVLVRKLLNKGYRVSVLDNMAYGDHGIADNLRNNKFSLIKGDVRNISDITSAIKGVDAVIDLAAIVGDPACKAKPEDTLEINYFSTKILAEICKYSQVNRFLFASTCSVYGASDGNDFLNEESPLNPVSLYAEAKINSEKEILAMKDGNFSPTILRMPTLFGLSPRMRFDLVINLLTAKAITDGEITVFGGQQWRPFLHTEDAADAYILCLEAPLEKIAGQVFNVGTNANNYKIIEIAEMIKKAVPSSKIIVNDELKDKRNYKISFDRFNSVFPFKTNKMVVDGITEIAKLDKEVLNDYKNPRYNNYYQ